MKWTAQFIALPILLTLIIGCATNLSTAIEEGDVQAVKNALENGANAKGSYWTSWKFPVQRAIENGDLKVLQLLLDNGADIHSHSMLHAAAHGQSQVIPFLATHGASLTVCGSVPHTKTWTGHDDLTRPMPPTGFAIARKDIESLRTFIELGSPLAVTCEVPANPTYTFSSILAGAVVGDPSIVEYLLLQGAEPNQLRTDGKTPIAIAAERGYRDIVRILLAAGAYHTYSEALKQPIEYASMNGHHDVVELLRYAGASMPIQRDEPGNGQDWIGALTDVAILVGTSWLIYEGAKYSAYSAPSSSSAPDTKSTYWRNGERKPSTGEAECSNDIQCDGLQICLKKPGHLRGICARDTSLSLSGSRDTVGSSFPRSIEARPARDCPSGFRWDLIYQTCIQ